jgi:hypothetical protein
MGKRELLLVFGFVIVGVVMYQATARPPQPGERGLSLSRLLESARREIRGNQANAETTTTTNHEDSPDLTELRIAGPIAEVEVVGENRTDVESTAHVESYGYDEAEAREYVKSSKLVSDRTASALVPRMEFPRGGRQRGTLKLKVPSRLQVHVEGGSGQLQVSNVAALEISGTRGETTLRKIPGRVEISHRGGEVEIEDVGALEFTGRSGTLKVTGVRGDTTIKMEQGGEVTASRLAGALDVDGRNCDIGLEELSSAKGPVRVNLNGGSLKIRGLRADTRIDSRNAEVEVAMSAPAPVAIYSNGERVSLTPPPGSYTLDARVTDGRVSPDDLIASMGFKSTSSGEDTKEARVFGPFKGGGPTISVRTTNGDFTLRKPDDSSKPADKPKTEETPALEEKPNLEKPKADARLK